MGWTNYQSSLYPGAKDVNSLFTFQLKPTIFGAQLSYEGGEPLTAIIQYDDASDDWLPIGYMDTPRMNHDVIAVPDYFCRFL